MIKHRQRLAVMAAVLALFVTVACGVTTSAVSELPPGWAETMAANTMSAMQTAVFTPGAPTSVAIAAAVDTAIPTQSPTITRTPTPTNTPIPPLTQRPTYTLTPTPTNTAVRLPPTATRYSAGKNKITKKGGVIVNSCTGEVTYLPCKPHGVSANAPCLQAELVEDVTIPSGQIIAPGTPFRKIWRVKNAGTCTWPADTHMIPANGNLWIGTGLNVGKNVKPGGIADFAVDITAPASAGEYSGNWFLDLSGTVALGPTNGGAFNIRIHSLNTSGVLWDFADQVCKAKWENNNCTTLSCPGTSGSKSGFALRGSPVTLEDGNAYSPVLWTQPFMQKKGTITGTFPALLLQGGEYLSAQVGCLYGYTACHVRFEIYLRYLGQPSILLNASEQTYDGSTAFLAQNYALPTGYVGFILKLVVIEEPASAQGGWFNIKISR